MIFCSIVEKFSIQMCVCVCVAKHSGTVIKMMGHIKSLSLRTTYDAPTTRWIVVNCMYNKVYLLVAISNVWMMRVSEWSATKGKN